MMEEARNKLESMYTCIQFGFFLKEYNKGERNEERERGRKWVEKGGNRLINSIENRLLLLELLWVLLMEWLLAGEEEA